MTKKFVIYEAAMCCSSGVCGPSPDQSLIQLQDTIDKVQDLGAVVERYSITGAPKKFRENPEVVKIIQEKQIKALPIATYNDKVFKVGSYPSFDEFKAQLNPSDKQEMPIKPEMSFGQSCCSGTEMPFGGGCCSGQDYSKVSSRPSDKEKQGRGPGRCC